MQTIRIGVVRSRSYRMADGFVVHGDGGTGTMDWERPVTSRRVMLWEDAADVARHLLGGEFMGPHLDAVRSDGHLEGTHLLDEKGFPATVVAYESDPLAFGRFRHAIVMQDTVGNSLTGGVTVYETVVNSAPPPPNDFRASGYDGVERRMEFSFTASTRLIG